MTQLPHGRLPHEPAAVHDLEPTREIRLPPVPAPRREPGGLDQPTDRLRPPDPRQPTGSFGPWHPLQPRVVPRHRSRAPYVIAVLVLLVLATGVVAVLVWG